jgi:hypothetical protein
MGRRVPGTFLEDGQKVEDFAGRQCAIGSPGCWVTKANEGQSAHEYALAIDLYEYEGALPRDDKNPKASNARQQKMSRYKGKQNKTAFVKVRGEDFLSELYRDIKIACEAAGMESGATWKDPDVRHCQVKGFKWSEALKKVQAQDFIEDTNYIKM